MLNQATFTEWKSVEITPNPYLHGIPHIPNAGYAAYREIQHYRRLRRSQSLLLPGYDGVHGASM